MKTQENIPNGALGFGIPREQWARVQVLHGLNTTAGKPIEKGETVQIINVARCTIRTFIAERKIRWTLLLQTSSGQAYFTDVGARDIRLID